MTVEQLDTAIRGHHPDSPSSLQASEACPCFLNEQRESQAGKDGVLQHKAAELRDLSILGGNEDMERAVQRAIDYRDNVAAEFKLSRTPVVIARETYLSVGTEMVTDGKGDIYVGVTGGFPDIEFIGEKHAVIIDDKFGRVPVTPAKDNLQGIPYVLGRFEKSPSLETIRMDFHAPYQGWDAEQQRLKFSYTFRRDEIPRLELRVRTVIARKHEAYKQLASGDWSMARPKHDLCLWCARKGTCPKVGALVATTVEKYQDLSVPDEVKEYRLTRLEQVAVAWRFASQMGPIIDAIKRRCVDVSVTEDLKPEGFTIVKQQKRAVQSVKAVLDVAESNGLNRDEAIELLSVPLGELEEALKAKAAPRQGTAKIRAFASELAECGATVLGKPFYFLREQKTPAEKQQNAIDV